MINRTRTGFYKLIETRKQVKVLYLDNAIFAWPETKQYGEMLVVSHRIHKTDRLLGMGHYNIYSVENEPNISDNMHLELEVGKGCWQGYLLLTGLPDNHKIRGRIIPTNEVITGNPRFNDRSTEIHKNLAKAK